MAQGLFFDALALKLDPSWRIASCSSKRDGRPRWTEINIYVLPAEEIERLNTKRRFVAEVLAKSSLAGETTKTRRVAAGTLDRALDWIDDSDLGMAVKVQAREYQIEQGPNPTLAVLGLALDACEQATLIDCDYDLVERARVAVEGEIARLGGPELRGTHG